MSEQRNGSPANVGTVLEIKGVVIDAVFAGNLPEINTALRITMPAQSGRDAVDLIAEVQQHLGDDRVRAVAMDSTDGIPRGVEVVDTGGPISVPVGDATLGRIFNVLGDTIDHGDPVEGGERWSIHREPPSFEDLDPTAEILETGIKVIDLLAPYVKGGKVASSAAPAPARRCCSRSSSTTSPMPTAACPCLPGWGSAPARATTCGTR